MTTGATEGTSTATGALARRRDFQWHPPRWLAVASVIATVAAYVVVARSATFPLIPLDEMIMIGDSRIIAGDGNAWVLTGGGFMPGLAVLMAPLWWFTSNPVLVYQLGIWITVVLALVTIWPLAVLARRIGVTAEAGVVVACVVMLAPARILVANFLLSETLITLATAMVAVAGIRLVRTHAARDAVFLGLATGLAVLAHGRGVAVVLAVLIWCLTLLRVCARPAMLAVAVAIVSSLAAFALYVAVSPQSPGEDARVSDTVANVTATPIKEMFATLVGELWYASLAWPLVLLLGAGLVLKHARRKPDLALIVILVVCAVAMSTSQLTHPADVQRIDMWFYGRYNDHVWTLLAVIGLAVAIRWVWPKIVLIVTAVAAALAVLMLVVTVPLIPATHGWQALHVFGIAPWLSYSRLGEGLPQQWTLMCAAGVALTLALGLLSLLRAWILPVVAVVWLALSLTYDANVVDVRNGARNPTADRWAFGVFQRAPRSALTPRLAPCATW